MARLSETGAHGVAASNVGGGAHNGRMSNLEICERCEGSGADPMQTLVDDLVELCIECRGDGLVICFDHADHEQLLPLSA
jgi:DnaJ-class molecular chaperone